jgi:hypothetical protein
MPSESPRASSQLVTPILLVMAIGCGTSSPGTSVRIALDYDDGLRLDTAEVTVVDRAESAPIAHTLLLLVPDAAAGTEMPLEIWGRRAGRRAAYGATTVIPERDATISAAVTLTSCSPGCAGNLLTTCTGPTVACTLGCSETGDAHCIGARPSNGVDPVAADPLRGTITIAGDATFDADTGAISGALTRDAGPGVDAGIGYVQVPAFAAGGAPLGIFVFPNLTIEAAATVRFTGTRAVVLLIGDAAKLAGTIDVSAGRSLRPTPGPGGGAGGAATVALGCGPGSPGNLATLGFSGGAGGGGGTPGGAGGSLGGTAGGAAGKLCLPASLEPLQGGSGGGAGHPVAGATGSRGGGGGGALQITAGGRLEVTGKINAGGAGGEGGGTIAGGGGGGSGGAILLEAPTVVIANAAIIAANGGGGGGNLEAPGDSGAASTTPAKGGFGPTDTAAGGRGGAGGSSPGAGTNSSGGGGAVGAIAIRGRDRTILGTTSPAATLNDITPRE